MIIHCQMIFCSIQLESTSDCVGSLMRTKTLVPFPVFKEESPTGLSHSYQHPFIESYWPDSKSCICLIMARVFLFP